MNRELLTTFEKNDYDGSVTHVEQHTSEWIRYERAWVGWVTTWTNEWNTKTWNLMAFLFPFLAVEKTVFLFGFHLRFTIYKLFNWKFLRRKSWLCNGIHFKFNVDPCLSHLILLPLGKFNDFKSLVSHKCICHFHDGFDSMKNRIFFWIGGVMLWDMQIWLCVSW